jgi:hypothetical protein
MTNPKAFIHIQKLRAANFPSSYPLDNTPAKPVSILASIRMSNARAVGLLATFAHVPSSKTRYVSKPPCSAIHTDEIPCLAFLLLLCRRQHGTNCASKWLDSMHSVFNDGLIATNCTTSPKRRSCIVISLKFSITLYRWLLNLTDICAKICLGPATIFMKGLRHSLLQGCTNFHKI